MDSIVQNVRGRGNLSVIANLYVGFTPEFKAEIEQDYNGRCFFELLKIEESNQFPKVLGALFSYYDSKDEIFKFGDNHLMVTLEDILYITGLPISGLPVFCENSRDKSGFQRVFGQQMVEMKLNRLATIAGNESEPVVRKKRAIMMLILYSIIMPSKNGTVPPTFLKIIEGDNVDEYAWGAALLAFLITGMKKYANESSIRKELAGNVWILMSFFLIRFPELREVLNINWIEAEQGVPLLCNIVKSVSPISHNHKMDMKKVNKVIVKICNGQSPIQWAPYQPSMLPNRVRDQARLVTIAAPLLCYINVAVHRPHLVYRQFEIFQLYKVSECNWEEPIIPLVNNSGGNEQDFMTPFADVLKQWTNAKLAHEYMPLLNPAEVEHVHDVNEVLTAPLASSMDMPFERDSLGTSLDLSTSPTTSQINMHFEDEDSSWMDPPGTCTSPNSSPMDMHFENEHGGMVCQMNDNIPHAGLISSSVASEAELEFDESCSLSGDKPFFHATLTKTPQLNVPACIASNFPRAVVPMVLTHGGKEWNISYIGNARCPRFDCSQWRAFLCDNNLVCDDVCIFEIMESSKEIIRLRVIFLRETTKLPPKMAALFASRGKTPENAIEIE